MPNTELLRQTYDYIAAHPEEWDQHVWARKTSCGTAYCFAGRAVVLAHPDAEFIFGTAVIDADDYEDAHYVRLPGQTGARSIKLVARELLGLDAEDAGRLFEESNDLEDLETEIGQILLAASQSPQADV